MGRDATRCKIYAIVKCYAMAKPEARSSARALERPNQRQKKIKNNRQEAQNHAIKKKQQQQNDTQTTPIECKPKDEKEEDEPTSQPTAQRN